MKFLLKIHGKGKGKAKAHLWDGKDTVCRMWSTGGLKKQAKFSVCDSANNHGICHMCHMVSEKRKAA